MSVIGANELRVKHIIKIGDKLYRVVKPPIHTQPGKGGAYLQVEMKDIRTGTKLNERFRSAENIERVILEQTDYQYMYTEKDNVILMNMNDYEQIEVPSEKFGDQLPFLEENMKIIVETYETEIISVELPEHIVCQIDQADPALKGQTVTSSFKPALLTNGVKVMVPQFVESGDKIVIRSLDFSYVERYKND